MKSTYFQIQAIRRQFPALFAWPDGQAYGERNCPLVRDDRIESVSVARVTQSLMAERPSRSTQSGNLVSIDDDRAFILLGDDFSVLAEVRQDEEHWAPDGTSARDGETVGEAIARLPDPRAVAYVLERHTGFTVEGYRSIGGYQVTLYKAPRGWTISEWIARKQHVAERQLSAQLLAIDTWRLATQGEDRR